MKVKKKNKPSVDQTKHTCIRWCMIDACVCKLPLHPVSQLHATASSALKVSYTSSPLFLLAGSVWNALFLPHTPPIPPTLFSQRNAKEFGSFPYLSRLPYRSFLSQAFPDIPSPHFRENQLSFFCTPIGFMEFCFYFFICFHDTISRLQAPKG